MLTYIIRASNAISATGLSQVNVASDGLVYVSDNFGVNWRSTGSKQNWFDVAISDTGVYITAVARGGNIYVSGDSGYTWIPADQNRNWQGISMTTSGMFQVACAYGNYIYVSSVSKLLTMYFFLYFILFIEFRIKLDCIDRR